MRLKEWKKMSFFVICAGLFVLVLLVVFHFVDQTQTVDLTPEPQEEPILFHNSSDMSEQEIRLFVEEKRMELQDFFTTAQYYAVHDISNEYSEEDNSKYLVVDEDFLKKLQDLLTVEAYGVFFEEFQEIVPREDLGIDKRFYLARRDLFDYVYVGSAIATFDVSEETLFLETATPSDIKARIRIRLCDEENLCSRDDAFRFLLKNEDGVWKIDDFTSLIK